MSIINSDDFDDYNYIEHMEISKILNDSQADSETTLAFLAYFFTGKLNDDLEFEKPGESEMFTIVDDNFA